MLDNGQEKLTEHCHKTEANHILPHLCLPIILTQNKCKLSALVRKNQRMWREKRRAETNYPWELVRSYSIMAWSWRLSLQVPEGASIRRGSHQIQHAETLEGETDLSNSRTVRAFVTELRYRQHDEVLKKESMMVSWREWAFRTAGKQNFPFWQSWSRRDTPHHMTQGGLPFT